MLLSYLIRTNCLHVFTNGSYACINSRQIFTEKCLKAQDALTKAMERGRSDLNLSKREVENHSRTTESPIQLEIKKLVNIVREESHCK